MLGHRGLSHSLPFAAAFAALLTFGLRGAQPAGRATLWLFLFLATASHGVLDAFTNGGLGVGFFAPFSGTRYFFPARPILVSPLGIAPFFSASGVTVLLNELTWIWMPSAIVVLISRRMRQRA
jgi:inner membrane protein